MRKFVPVLASAALLASMAPAQVEAKGCIRGAMAGAVVGHYAGHHAIAGAVGGCLAARAYFKHKAAKDAQAKAQPAPAAAH